LWLGEGPFPKFKNPVGHHGCLLTIFEAFEDYSGFSTSIFWMDGPGMWRLGEGLTYASMIRTYNYGFGDQVIAWNLGAFFNDRDFRKILYKSGWIFHLETLFYRWFVKFFAWSRNFPRTRLAISSPKMVDRCLDVNPYVWLASWLIDWLDGLLIDWLDGGDLRPIFALIKFGLQVHLGSRRVKKNKRINFSVSSLISNLCGGHVVFRAQDLESSSLKSWSEHFEVSLYITSSTLKVSMKT